MGTGTEKRMLELLNAGRPFVAATIIEANEPARLGAKMLLLSDGGVEGTSGRPEWDEKIVAAAPEVAEKGARLIDLEGGKAFLDPHRAEPKMVICGAGHIALPLARFALELGFSITVIDDREDFADPSRFPGCRTLHGEYPEVLETLDYGPETAVVVVTRGHTYDIDCLMPVLSRDAGYVGLIGSRRRVGFVKKELLARGIAKERVEELFTPIGFNIGAESPAEIAVSIVAEIIALRRLGRGGARKARNRGEAS